MIDHRTGIALYVAAGLLFGLGHSTPVLWPLAWPSVVVLVVALEATRSRWGAVAGCVTFMVLTYAVSTPWIPGLTGSLSPELSRLPGLALTLAVYAALALPVALALSLAYAALGPRRIAGAVPLAFALGESAGARLHTLSPGDWLVSQWQFRPVLDAVSWLGWWPTSLLCLGACSCAGAAISRRRPALMAPSGAVLVLLLALPRAPAADPTLLEGLVAVQTSSSVSLPSSLPPGTAVVVWPEAAFQLRPQLGEGPAQGPRLPPLSPGFGAEHLVGLLAGSSLRGEQNQAVLIDSTGMVRASRAKSLLFPVGERSFLGVGKDRLLPGKQDPVIRVGQRGVIALICGEFLDRRLVRLGREHGGEVLLVLSRDHVLPTARARRQLLATQVMRSVEFGVPSVRSSYRGQAAFVDADGTVLARGTYGDEVLLTQAGSTPLAADGGPTVAVLFSRGAEEYRTRCPAGRCSYHPLEDFACRANGETAVVVAGHGLPPTYLSHPPDEVAQAVACFGPRVVVLDACYGASATLLAALAGSGLDGLVVAAPRLLPSWGLGYGAAFFRAGAPAERAAAVWDPGGGRLLRWSVNAAELEASIAGVKSAAPGALAERVVRRDPPLVLAPLGSAGSIVVAVDQAPGRARWKRLRRDDR